jgi:hypothetical protein
MVQQGVSATASGANEAEAGVAAEFSVAARETDNFGATQWPMLTRAGYRP